MSFENSRDRPRPNGARPARPRATDRIRHAARELFYRQGIRPPIPASPAPRFAASWRASPSAPPRPAIAAAASPTNACIEYPETGHPARLVAEANKRAPRQRLTEMAAAMGAAEPDVLGDGLLLLMEGAFASGQLFGEEGPARSVTEIAHKLIAATTAKRA